jgi:V/A-type H+-transporting ATPase subunit C
MSLELSVFRTRAMRYAFSNARVKAMKAALLPKETVGQLVAADRVGDVVALLERTDYKDDLAEPALKHSGADLVEFALGRHMARKARKVLSFTPKESVRAVLSVLEKWDAYNLKTILLAKHLGHSAEDVAPLLVPAGEMDSQDLARLQAQEKIEDVASFLSGTAYGNALAPLLAEYRKTGSIQPLLNAVDKAFYSNLSRSVSPSLPDGGRILSVVKSSIDNRNAVNILRGKREAATEQAISSFIIDGGTLSRNSLAPFVRASTADEATKLVIERFRLGPALEAHGAGRASLVAIEIELERRVLRFGFKALRASVLSPGALVGYLLLKENEVNNIRKIVRGKEFNLPPAKIKETLIFAD